MVRRFVQNAEGKDLSYLLINHPDRSVGQAMPMNGKTAAQLTAMNIVGVYREDGTK